MKIKKEYIILILIIIGLGGYLLMRSSDRTLYQLPELAGLEQKHITQIEIIKNNESIRLKKKDNQWYFEPSGYLADSNKVNAMLNVFETLTLTALISDSKEYNRYDLNDEKRITVKAWQQEALKRNFDIGKPASSFRHTYVRLDGDSRVYHARDNFRGQFDLTADNLRDKNVLSFTSTDIQEVHITADRVSSKWVRSQVPVTPQQKASEAAPPVVVKFEWHDSEGKKGDDQKISRLLTTLGSLKCTDYINDRRKDVFSAPIYALRLKGGRDYRLDIFAKLQTEDKNYPAISSDSDHPFLLSDSQVQQIMIKPEEMIINSNSGENKPPSPKPE